MLLQRIPSSCPAPRHTGGNWFFEFLGHALRGDFELVLAPQTVAEVLRWAEIKGGQRQAALEFLLATGRFELAPDPSLKDVQANLTLVRDETDVPIALSAIQAGVNCLVTNDNDFHAEDTQAALAQRGIRHQEWSDLVPPP